MNAAAEALLREPRAPLRLELGILCAASGDVDSQLRAAISAAAQILRGRPSGPPAMLRLRRAAGGTLALMLCPAPGPEMAGLPPGPLILAFANPGGDGARPDVDVLIAEFGFSRAEAEIAASLAAGLDVDEIAARRTVARETVRTQLKSALSKSDTRTQSQLVGLVLRSLAALSRRSR